VVAIKLNAIKKTIPKSYCNKRSIDEIISFSFSSQHNSVIVSWNKNRCMYWKI